MAVRIGLGLGLFVVGFVLALYPGGAWQNKDFAMFAGLIWIGMGVMLLGLVDWKNIS